jgi:hypothetical protein
MKRALALSRFIFLPGPSFTARAPCKATTMSLSPLFGVHDIVLGKRYWHGNLLYGVPRPVFDSRVGRFTGRATVGVARRGVAWVLT